MTTDQKGAIAELAIAQAAVKLDIGVYRPVVDGGRYDLIFEVNTELVRVQCKWAARHGDVLTVRCYSCRRNRDGLVTRKYAAGEIDAFAAYCLDLNRCYFLPYDVFGARRQISLRLAPTRNNQNLGVNWASSYEFEATLGGSSRGRSSAGRAPRWHRGGHGFEPRRLHSTARASASARAVEAGPR